MKKYRLPIIAAIAGLLAGRFLLQAPVKTETKEVVKYVEKKQEDKKKNIVIVKRQNKDGSIETRTEIKEDTKTRTDSKLDSSKSVATKTGSGVTVGVLALKDLSRASELDYGLSVTVPIHGAVKLQAIGTTGKTVGAGVAIEF